MPGLMCSFFKNICVSCFRTKKTINHYEKPCLTKSTGSGTTSAESYGNKDTKDTPVKIYDKMELLGRGAHSKVYKITINDNVFIKKDVDIRYKNNIIREKHVLKKLNSLHDSATDFPVYVTSCNEPGLSCIITKYVEGEDLFDWFNRDKKARISENTVKQIFKEMVRLVRILHGYGFVHLDIKMENFILLKTNDNSIKLSLIDFDMTHTLYTDKIKIYKMVGTRGYCDYYIYDKLYSDKSDIWSLGVCLWVLIEKRNPFNHPTDKKTFTKKDFIPVSYRSPIYDKYKKTAIPIIESMLQIEHEDRVSLENVFNNAWLNSY